MVGISGQPPVALNGHQCKHESHQNRAKRNPVTIPVAFEPERALTRSFGSDGTVAIIYPTYVWFVLSADRSFFSFFSVARL